MKTERIISHGKEKERIPEGSFNFLILHDERVGREDNNNKKIKPWDAPCTTISQFRSERTTRSDLETAWNSLKPELNHLVRALCGGVCLLFLVSVEGRFKFKIEMIIIIIIMLGIIRKWWLNKLWSKDPLSFSQLVVCLFVCLVGWYLCSNAVQLRRCWGCRSRRISCPEERGCCGPNWIGGGGRRWRRWRRNWPSLPALGFR